MRTLARLFLSAAVIAALSACGGPKVGPVPDGSSSGTGNNAPTAAATGGTSSAANAEALYKKNCASCHGDNLEGKLGANSSLQKVGSKLSKEEITSKILKGGNGMIAYKGRLKDNEIAALSDWLAAQK